MATATLPIDHVHTEDNERRLGIFCLIWLDANTNSKDYRDTEQNLRSIINRLEKFHDITKCQKYISERSQYERVVMIVSGRMGEKIVPFIYKLRQVISIYVYCMDKGRNERWALHFTKVKAVITKLDKLVSRIRKDHRIQKIVEEPFSINIYTKGKSTDGVNGKFVFSQVLIDCLLRLQYTRKDKRELIKVCKNEHKDNHFELSNLHEFRKHYSPDKVLWWYTRDSFFYKTLNAVLRTENIHLTFLFRTFIADISHQLKYYQAKKSLRVYRGQMITSAELQTLQKYVGQFISVNSFFSSTVNKEQALSFLKVPGDTENLDAVLFEIVADPKVATSKPFADISAFSEFPGESEVLFMLGSIFRLDSVDRHSYGHISIIRMTLCSENESDLKNVLIDMKRELGSGQTNLRTLGTLLREMGKFDLAEKYLTRLLKELPLNYPILADLYQELSKVAALAGDYDKSVKYRQKSLTLNTDQLHNRTFLATMPISELKKNGYEFHNIQLMQPTETSPVGLKLTKQQNPLQYIITAVAKYTKADLAGLKVNDWLIKIENTDIRTTEFSEVSHTIRDLLTNAGLINMVIARKKTSISPSTSGEYDKRDIRLIVLNEAAGLDFNSFISENDSQLQTHFISSVQPLSLADKAGLRDGDRILTVNDIDVTHAIHEDVCRMMQTKKPLQLTVVNDPKYIELIENVKRNQTITEDSTVRSRSPARHVSSDPISDLKISPSKSLSPSPPIEDEDDGLSKHRRVLFTVGKVSIKIKHCILRKDPTYNGYGLVLRYQNGLHLIDQVEDDSPAYIAGLREDDIILYADKKNVQQLTHDDVKILIRKLSIKNMDIDLILMKKSDVPRYKNYEETNSINWKLIFDNILNTDTIPTEQSTSSSIHSSNDQKKRVM
ncbi:unnamed protein product [Rotaria socialis]|uniref:PDZ domain-containing protein n=1 Tax=Rotaria socialis TaxID=392032 RepID=A0A817PLD1_9BILA|nr:unnamed protein product [Rotaria socialis]